MNEMDLVRLNFNPQSLWALNAIIGLVMYGVALDLQPIDARAHRANIGVVHCSDARPRICEREDHDPVGVACPADRGRIMGVRLRRFAIHGRLSHTLDDRGGQAHQGAEDHRPGRPELAPAQGW